MSVVIPDEVLQAANLTEAELKRELAVLLFQQERFTLGQSAHFADVPLIDFQRLLASRDIPLHYGVEEFEKDLETIGQARRT